MASPLTVRIDGETRRRLERAAAQRGLVLSEAMREALAGWVERNAAASRPYDLAADLIGCVRSGDGRLSVETGRAFARLLQARRGRSRGKRARS